MLLYSIREKGQYYTNKLTLVLRQVSILKEVMCQTMIFSHYVLEYMNWFKAEDI